MFTLPTVKEGWIIQRLLEVILRILPTTQTYTHIHVQEEYEHMFINMY